MTPTPSLIANARAAFHDALLAGTLIIDGKGVPSNADKDSVLSVAVAKGIASSLKAQTTHARGAGQTSGTSFESACADFLRATFLNLQHLRPGRWEVYQLGGGKGGAAVSQYSQYEHLSHIAAKAAADLQLAASLGNDYTIKPDVVITRLPESDAVISPASLALPVLSDGVATRAVLRESANPLPMLHASISCKWTMRSDRAQNARSEALNFIRNRKGRLPHIVAVTAEPMPSRIGSLALGTGDMDCVYHFALYELEASLKAFAATGKKSAVDAMRDLTVLIDGGRLKDISDLPLDLAV